MKKRSAIYDKSTVTKLMDLRDAEKWPEFFDLIYRTIVDNRADVLEDGYPTDGKIKWINMAIDYYKDTEEYERCKELLDVVEDIRLVKSATKVAGGETGGLSDK